MTDESPSKTQLENPIAPQSKIPKKPIRNPAETISRRKYPRWEQPGRNGYNHHGMIQPMKGSLTQDNRQMPSPSQHTASGHHDIQAQWHPKATDTGGNTY